MNASEEREPIVETVLGVQFEPMPRFKTAHLGAFWSSLPDSWPRVGTVPALGQMYLGPPPGEDPWMTTHTIQLGVEADTRIQIVNAAGDAMIQLENGWLVYNWRRVGAGASYPHYETNRDRFFEVLENFKDFVQARALGRFRATVWELGYINAFEREKLWTSLADWPRLLPGLLIGLRNLSTGSLKSFSGTWEYSPTEFPGRVQIQVTPGRHEFSDLDSLGLTLVAQGPLANGTTEEMRKKMDDAHLSLLKSFGELRANGTAEEEEIR